MTLEEFKARIELYQSGAKSGAHWSTNPKSENWEVGQYDAYTLVLEQLKKVMENQKETHGLGMEMDAETVQGAIKTVTTTIETAQKDGSLADSEMFKFTSLNKEDP